MHDKTKSYNVVCNCLQIGNDLTRVVTANQGIHPTLISYGAERNTLIELTMMER